MFRSLIYNFIRWESLQCNFDAKNHLKRKKKKWFGLIQLTIKYKTEPNQIQYGLDKFGWFTFYNIFIESHIHITDISALNIKRTQLKKVLTICIPNKFK